MANIEKNAQIISLGTIRPATKLSVLTICIGHPDQCKEVKGTIEHTTEGTILYTKEAPQGITYDSDRKAVVRVLRGIVLIDGRYDIYCPASEKLPDLLSNPVDLEEICTIRQLAHLDPVLKAAEEVIASMAPAESGRRVVVVTPQLIEEIGADGTDEKGAYILERDEWDENPDSPLTRLYSGDIFFISDEKARKGYRIGAEEFELTHKLDD